MRDLDDVDRSRAPLAQGPRERRLPRVLQVAQRDDVQSRHPDEERHARVVRVTRSGLQHLPRGAVADTLAGSPGTRNARGAPSARSAD
ncbi:Uncharacterised protein [Mycobacteroides abscessus]|nr:Uncharacterised protein [Mycobacteroides abscessus]